MSNFDEFKIKFPDTQVSKPLATLNTMRIGGMADLYYKLTLIEELPDLIQTAKQLKIPYFVLGGGSNTIFADEGFRGLVIHIQAKNIAVEPALEPDSNPSDSRVLAIDAGSSLSQVIQFALKNNLIGLEKLTGVPGTIGGAVRGNAGAYGIEIKDFFQKALLYSPKKGLHEADIEYLNFSYRSSVLKKEPEIVLRVYLKLAQGTPEQAKKAQEEAADILKNRVSKQPKGFSTGSIFKNPGGGPNDPTGQNQALKAGYLLEQVGAKGLQVGQIKVSELHANWFINLGGGTQKDLVALVKTLKERVKNSFNVDLELEIELV